jgi:ferrous iron transport protein B
MEDTGYMARAAFMMDKLMHKIGLHGRSFIPLIMGFGCNVPAIMATRTIRNKTDRLLTMLIVPFMSCSARLPVYILFIGAFFPDSPTLVLISLYLLGIVLAIITAHVFNKTVFRSKEQPFVMELPPYRIPSGKSTLKHMWDKSAQYVQKVGGVILVAVVVIWALGYFPREENVRSEYSAKIEVLQQHKDTLSLSAKAGVEHEIAVMESKINGEQLANSYLGKIGHFVEPIIKPLGFDWRMGIALLSGVAAKEVVVSTIGVIMQAEVDKGGGEDDLIPKLQTMKYNSGKKVGQLVFTPLVAIAFLIFVLIYSPCIGVIGAIAKESGRWKWAFLMVGYTTALAWVVSFLGYQIGSLF